MNMDNPKLTKQLDVLVSRSDIICTECGNVIAKASLVVPDEGEVFLRCLYCAGLDEHVLVHHEDRTLLEHAVSFSPVSARVRHQIRGREEPDLIGYLVEPAALAQAKARLPEIHDWI